MELNSRKLLGITIGAAVGVITSGFIGCDILPRPGLPAISHPIATPAAPTAIPTETPMPTPTETPEPTLPSLLSSSPVWGQDYYANQSGYWNVTNSVRYPMMPPPRASGVLDVTFGTSTVPTVKLLTEYTPSKFRIHIINGTCIRNGNCGSYEIGHGFGKASFDSAVRTRNRVVINKFIARLKVWQKIIVQFPHIDFYISPELEHDLSQNSWRILADYVHKYLPSVTLVNSPDGGITAERYRGALIERHGNKPQTDADIVSLDGVDASQIDIGAFINRVEHLPHVQIALIWQGLYNCRVSGAFIDPRARKTCPTAQTYELLAHITDHIPPSPPFAGGSACRIMRPFASPDILKPIAERSNNYDPRQDLPVLITKAFGKNNVYVIDKNGKRLGSLGYYSNYLDRGNRYYSGYRGGSRLSGYEFQKAAEESSGSPWVWLTQSGVCKGPLLMSQRQGQMDG